MPTENGCGACLAYPSFHHRLSQMCFKSQEYSRPRFLRQPTEQINKMVHYLKTYYCIVSASFKPEMWAGLDAIGKSTNNGAESFHIHFGDFFGYLRCKPSLPHFLRNMAKYNTYKDMKLMQTHGQPYSKP